MARQSLSQPIDLATDADNCKQASAHSEKRPRGLDYRVNLLANALLRHATRVYEDAADLRVPETRVLGIIGEYGAVSAQEITHCVSMDKAQVSRAIKSLSQRGLVNCKRDAKDNRRVILTLTDKGVTAHDTVTKARDKRRADVRALFSDEEFDTLLALLDRLRDGLAKIDPPGQPQKGRCAPDKAASS